MEHSSRFPAVIDGLARYCLPDGPAGEAGVNPAAEHDSTELAAKGVALVFDRVKLAMPLLGCYTRHSRRGWMIRSRGYAMGHNLDVLRSCNPFSMSERKPTSARCRNVVPHGELYCL